MKREIVLSSYSVKNQGNNRPENFITRFNKPITLDSNYEYEIGLNRIINMSFTWFNVNPDYGNQLIKYSSDNGSTFQDITFPSGVWNYTDFDEHIKEITKTGDNDDPTYPINISFDTTTFRVTIELATNYQLDLSQSNFNDLIGFDKKVVKDAVNIGQRVPNLSQVPNHCDLKILVIYINVHCDLVNSSLVDGDESNLYFLNKRFETELLIYPRATTCHI